MHSIQAVAFDIDGTMYSNPLLYFRSAGFGIRNAKEIKAFMRVRKYVRTHTYYIPIIEYQAQEFAKCLHISPEQSRAIIDTVVYKQWNDRICNMKIYKTIPLLLNRLRNAGIKTAVLSDFPTQKKLTRWSINTLFDVIINSEDCGKLKPAQEPFNAIANALDISAKNILYVGNSLHNDIIAAHNHGFLTAFYIDPLYRILQPSLARAAKNYATVYFSSYKRLQRWLKV